jgi:hypothetical protein
MCDKERPRPSRCENDWETYDGLYPCDGVPTIQTYEGEWLCDLCFPCSFRPTNYTCSKAGCLDPGVCIDQPNQEWLCEKHGKRCKGALDCPPYGDEMGRCIRHGVVDRTYTNGVVYCKDHFEKANELFAQNGNLVPQTSRMDVWVDFFFGPDHIKVDRVAPPDQLAGLQENHLFANLDAISTRLDKKCLGCGEVSLRKTKCCKKAICGVCLTEVALNIHSFNHKVKQYRCPGCRGDVRNIGNSGLEMATSGMKLQD